MMFAKHILDCSDDLFAELSTSCKFENVNKNGSRKGANLFDDQNDQMPLVRTTTPYLLPNQRFLPIHYGIINSIKETVKIDSELNSALVEIYNLEYRTMGFHSDQALDLNENSHICIYSCYSDPTTNDLRKLKIQHKNNGECYDIVMEHNSVIVFDTDTNLNHLHKIVLDKVSSNVQWLGITFRQSKTFISFIDEIPYFSSTNDPLVLADEGQRKEFFRCKGCENSDLNYRYPQLNCTVSPGDLIRPL